MLNPCCYTCSSQALAGSLISLSVSLLPVRFSNKNDPHEYKLAKIFWLTSLANFVPTIAKFLATPLGAVTFDTCTALEKGCG